MEGLYPTGTHGRTEGRGVALKPTAAPGGAALPSRSLADGATAKGRAPRRSPAPAPCGPAALRRLHRLGRWSHLREEPGGCFSGPMVRPAQPLRCCFLLQVAYPGAAVEQLAEVEGPHHSCPAPSQRLVPRGTRQRLLPRSLGLGRAGEAHRILRCLSPRPLVQADLDVAIGEYCRPAAVAGPLQLAPALHGSSQGFPIPSAA